MAGGINQDEIVDDSLTDQFAGSVTTTSTAVPSSPGTPISTVLIRMPNQTPTSRRLQYSFDNVTFHELSPGEFIAWSLKGEKTQIWIKANASTANYEITMNRE